VGGEEEISAEPCKQKNTQKKGVSLGTKRVCFGEPWRQQTIEEMEMEMEISVALPWISLKTMGSKKRSYSWVSRI
jgi:hypothetical protein